MSMFFLLVLCGLGELWMLLVLWGFSAGPINAIPFVALSGCLALMFVAAPLALFMPRIGAAVGLLGGALMLAWPVAMATTDPILSTLPFAVLPIAATGAAGRLLWRARRTRWLAFGPGPPVWVRIALCGLPFVLLFAILGPG